MGAEKQPYTDISFPFYRTHDDTSRKAFYVLYRQCCVTGTLVLPVGTAVDDNFNLYTGDQDGKSVEWVVPGSTSLANVINNASFITQLSALLFPRGVSDGLWNE
jgi:hypothetical protein